MRLQRSYRHTMAACYLGYICLLYTSHNRGLLSTDTDDLFGKYLAHRQSLVGKESGIGQSRIDKKALCPGVSDEYRVVEIAQILSLIHI